MRTKVKANNPEEAKRLIYQRLNIEKVVKIGDDSVDILKNIFGFD